MATKEDVLQYIKTLAEQKVVTKEELEAAFDSGSSTKADAVFTKKLGIAEILYYIGGGIVFLGIAILLWQNWSTLGFGTKVLATLGAGAAAYIVGLVCSRDERTETVGSAFYLLSALVMPIGLVVVFDHAGFDTADYSSQTLISGILLATYLLSYVVFRKNVFILFTILFGTWLFFSSTSFIIGDNPIFDEWKFYYYRILVAGLAYLLLGYTFSKRAAVPLQGFLYGFGILGFLGAALLLGGWEPHQNVF